MLRKRLWLSILVLAAAGTPCFAQQTSAVLFKRYERGGSVNKIIEDTFSLKIDVTPEDKLALSVRNIEGVRLLPSNRISARDVMNTRRVVLTRAALEKLQEALG